MTVLLFLAVLFVLILVHEWGHYIVAKRSDMQVDEFGIGFPPKLYGKKVGETEYTLNALPIGGFVRILGENSESSEFSPVESEAIDRRSEASAEAGEGGKEVKVSREVMELNPRSFVAKGKLAQAAVLVAGVTMNIIFAWFLFVVVYAVGVPALVDEAEAGADAKLMVTSVVPDSPAAAAEVPVGAEITSLSLGDETISELVPSQFSEFVKTHPDTDLTLTYRKGDVDFITSLTPQTGLSEENPDSAVVGVVLGLTEVERQPVHLALWEATKMTASSLVAITVGLSSLLADTILGQADFAQVAGPVGIADMVGDAADFGFTSLLLFTAFISLNLAVINMLPFPALDGGRLVFVAIEAVTRKPINPVWVMRLNAVGFLLLIGLMLAVTYNDILRII